jgi:dTDP-glucose pyrophosphorylase
MYIRNKSFILFDDAKIFDVISNLNETGYLICLISDSANRLLGTITDGDIRRGLLAGNTLDDLAIEIIISNPVVSYADSSDEHNNNLITQHQVKQIPIVDSKNIIQALYILDENEHVVSKKNTILIMAGGFGKRMMPLTNDIPKPMLEISGKPILEHIICNARSQGFSSFCISVHYLAEKIINYFEDGSKWDVTIEYINEELPLGTAGCMSLFKNKPSDPFIVTNGDLYSDINFSAILDFHKLNNADATMGVKEQKLRNPFGIIETQGLEIIKIEEKPIHISFVNSGIYVVNPNVLNFLESNKFKDMPDFFSDLQKKEKKIIAFPIHESWEDVGKPVDLNKANTDHYEQK